MTAWKRVTDSTTPVDGRQVLAAFEHPNGRWVQFVAHAHRAPYGVSAQGYAAPTHWRPLPEPPDSQDSSTTLMELFESADPKDWDWLLSNLGWGGYGRFWRVIFDELRSRISQ